MKILVTIENFNPEAKKILERLGEVEHRKGPSNDCEVIIVGLDRISKEEIDASPKLKLIASATTGLDHINVEYAQEKGIKVLSLRDEDLRYVTGTAELAFALLLALARRISEAFIDVKNGNWEREKFLGQNLSGKTLGIFGLGRLGSMMAQYGKAFGMKVIAYDPNKESAELARKVDFATLLAESDAISIHAPLSSETKNIFNGLALDKMKQGAHLINTARGAIVNEADLIRALENKIIAGYAADVLAGETDFGKDASGHPLIQYAKTHNNVIITPHIGGYTAQSRAATDIIIAKKVVETLSK